MYHYFPFISTGDYSGYYEHYNSTSFEIPIGNIGTAGNVLKFNSGTNAWTQTSMSLNFLNNELTIKSLSGTDWSTNLKNEWLNSYLTYTNLNQYLSNTQKNIIFNYIESIDLFQQLSSPSLAYVTRNDGTNGIIIDPLLINNEVSIGLNVYQTTFIMDYINTLPINNVLRNTVLTYYNQENYISNCCKITYKGYTNIVWCFEGIEYNYNLNNIGLVPNLINGGGNRFSEVKLAGNHIQAHYIVKKNIDPKDPTVGLVSGEFAPFCMGLIDIIDTSCWTAYSSTSGWTWIGDMLTQSQFYTWDIADVSDLTQYKYVPISAQLFPIRIIQFLRFNQFG